MSRVVVTGATGFIGSHLVEALLDTGEVIAAVRDPSRLGHLASRVTALPFDLEQPQRVQPCDLGDVSCIYHLASRVHVTHAGARDDEAFDRLNARATEALAKVAARAGVPRLVFVSSIKVNGERTADRPFSPDDPPAPEDAYARSKLAAELALRRVARETGLDVVVVRPPLVYGAGVGANFRRLIGLVERGWPLPLGRVRNRRSLISVWNLVDLLIRLGGSSVGHAPIWLASDGEDVSTPGLLERIGRSLGRTRVPLLPVPVPVLVALGSAAGYGPQIRKLVASLQVDISHTRAALGWQPPVRLDEGVARTVESFRKGCHAER